jgi:hypothetical protein
MHWAGTVGGILADPIAWPNSSTRTLIHAMRLCRSHVRRSVVFGSACIYPRDARAMNEDAFLTGAPN